MDKYNYIKYYNKFCDIIDKNKLFDDISSFVLLFSCGKDCSALLDMFLQYYNEHNMNQEFVIFSVQYPKHMYYDSNGRITSNFENIIKYWEKRGIEVRYITPPFDDFDDDDRDGCDRCKKSRKFEIDKFINSLSDKVGILTGFTIYDALAYLNILLLKCNFDISKLTLMEESEKNNITRMLHKMSLKEFLPNHKYMIRPMLPFFEKEILSYLVNKNIPYLTSTCKINKYKFKRLYSNALNLYDEIPVTYNGIENFLIKYGIKINNGNLEFNDVEQYNYFIDC